MRRVWLMRQNAYGCKGCHRYAYHNTADQSRDRTKSYGAEVVLYGDVYDEACAEGLRAGRRKMDIHLSIPLMISAVATGQGTIAMEIIKELPSGRLYPGSHRRWRTCYRCFHSGKTAKPEDQSDRCRTGRSKLYAGVFCSRKSDNSSDCQHDCRRYSGKDSRCSMIFPYLQQEFG